MRMLPNLNREPDNNRITNTTYKNQSVIGRSPPWKKQVPNIVVPNSQNVAQNRKAIELTSSIEKKLAISHTCKRPTCFPTPIPRAGHCVEHDTQLNP